MTWTEWIWSTGEMPMWLRLLQAAALIAIAVFTGFIAYRQYRIAIDKLQLDLFEKRWEVYSLALEFCGIVNRDFNPAHEDFRISWRARNRAQFLFGEDVNMALKELHHLGAALHAVAISLTAADGANREKLANRQYELTMQFHKVDTALAGVFAPYLTFELARK